jgi:hypothetical protein
MRMGIGGGEYLYYLGVFERGTQGDDGPVGFGSRTAIPNGGMYMIGKVYGS